MKLFFVNQATGSRFQILSWNKATGEIQLKGKTSIFTEQYDKDRFRKMGYVLVKEAASEQDDNEDDEE